MSNPKPHLKQMFGSVPLVLACVNEPAAIRYECQNRDTSLQLSSLASCAASAFHHDQQAPSQAGNGAAPIVNADGMASSDCRVPIIVQLRFVFARNAYPAVVKGLRASGSRFVTDAGEI